MEKDGRKLEEKEDGTIIGEERERGMAKDQE